MNRQAILIITLLICVLLSISLYAKSNDNSGNPTIIITKLNVTDTSLELHWEIRNDSDHDIWICDWSNVYGGFQFEVYLNQNNQTLCIQRRLDVLPEYESGYEPYSRYVRLRAGEERNESLSFSLPVNVRLLRTAQQKLQNPAFAQHLVLEIGYYNGDMPGMIREALTEAENVSVNGFDNNLKINDKHILDEFSLKTVYEGLLNYNISNEVFITRNIRSRDDELLLRYTDPPLGGGNIFQIKVDDIQIPCQKEKDWLQSRLPFLTPWSRIEIQFQPSMLEYFFPYSGQQKLLSHSEIQYLRSLKIIVIKNQELLRNFAREISKGSRGGIVARQNVANVTCYRAGEHLTSFTIYDNKSIETEEKQWFWYRSGLQNLKKLAPQIYPFEMRVKCASNLNDLWHRLRLYHLTEKRRLQDTSNKNETIYPTLTEWCNVMERTYASLGMTDENVIRPHQCPSAGTGKNHYAMNPNCRPDSPADMVLLFETEAGWNQHGGLELFTFDNHEPKGGCVLLNDGTVKFIRTTEELKQLRWK